MFRATKTSVKINTNMSVNYLVSRLFVMGAFLAVTFVMSSDVRADVALLPPMNGNPLDFAPRRAGAEANAFIKITVTNEGLYQIEQSALVKAGVNGSDLIGAHVRLYCATQEVSVYVSNNGLWAPGDGLVFYGKPFEGPQSDANVYWLALAGKGKRMGSRSALPLPGVVDTQTCDWHVSYRRYTQLQEKYLAQNEQFDHWFVGTLNATGATTISLPTDDVVTSQPARFSAVLYGSSTFKAVAWDHTTKVKINGLPIATFTFDGRNVVTGSCAFSADILQANASIQLTQKLKGDLTEDQVFLKELSLDYTRRLVVSDDTLVFQGQAGTNNYRIRGLSSGENYWVLDVSCPDAPIILSDASLSFAKGAPVIRFGDASPAAHRYAIWHPARLQTAAAIEAVTFPGLASTGQQVDYLVICPAAFQDQANRLVEWRASQGLSGRVVLLSDLYNEFSYGIADADAIKQFLGFAYHHWQKPAPRYVVLAGSGSYDPKGYLLEARGLKSFKAVERIPLHMGPSKRMWTSLDGWFAQVDGADKLPDLALGRLPAQSVKMLSNMVDKIITFESLTKDNPVQKKALLVADHSDASMDAKDACESARTEFLAPGGFWCNTAYSDDLDKTAVRRVLFDSVNAGVSLACYFGHGDYSYWGDAILSSDDVNTFQNKQFPVMLMMSCRNGGLQDPLKDPCIAEAMLRGVGRGASACIANTATAYGMSDVVFSRGFLREITINQAPRLGDSFLAGLADLNAFFGSTPELLYLNLFGDPAMTVNP